MIGLVLTCGRNLRPQVCNMLIISWFLMSQFATSNVWKNLSQLFFHCSWSQFATLNYCKLRPQCGVFNSSVATGEFTLLCIPPLESGAKGSFRFASLYLDPFILKL